eukprot:Awhi_evm1s12022
MSKKITISLRDWWQLQANNDHHYRAVDYDEFLVMAKDQLDKYYLEAIGSEYHIENIHTVIDEKRFNNE